MYLINFSSLDPSQNILCKDIREQLANPTSLLANSDAIFANDQKKINYDTVSMGADGEVF